MERYNTEVDIQAKSLPELKLLSKSNDGKKKSSNQNTMRGLSHRVERQASVPQILDNISFGDKNSKGGSPETLEKKVSNKELFARKVAQVKKESTFKNKFRKKREANKSKRFD